MDAMKSKFSEFGAWAKSGATNNGEPLYRSVLRCGACWQLVWTLISCIITWTGLGIVGNHFPKALDDTDGAMAALVIRKDKLPGYPGIRGFASSMITLMAFASVIALLVSIAHAMLAWYAKEKNEGKYARVPSYIYMGFGFPSLILCWITSALLVISCMGGAVLTGGCLAADVSAKALRGTGLNDKWKEVTEVYQGAVGVVQSINNSAVAVALNSLPDGLLPTFNGGIQELNRALPGANDFCNKTCLDLGDLDPVVDKTSKAARCLCSFDRIDRMQPYVRDAWKEHMIQVVIGLCLCWVGISWLAIDQTVQVTATYNKYKRKTPSVTAQIKPTLPVVSNSSANPPITNPYAAYGR